MIPKLTNHPILTQNSCSRLIAQLHARLPVRKSHLLLAGLLLPLLLAACAISPLAQTPEATAVPIEPPPDTFGGLVTSIGNYALPTPVPTPEVETTVIVNTNGARANIRNGPGLNFAIIAKGQPGQAFAVVSRSEDQAWWEICCIVGEEDTATEPTTNAWVAASVVRLAGEEETVTVAGPILETELSSQWEVDWECGSERCEVKSCEATVNARVNRTPSQQLLAVEHEVTWADTCFATDSWVFDVNQYTGKERTGEYENNFLYGYWLGGNPGQANGAYTLPDGDTVAVWCSGPHSVEIEEGGGWTTVYEGNTCHDVRTGMLVLLSYTKQWLFTGEFEGEDYERAYFGDNEVLNQRLISTTVALEFVAAR